ncbi:hypothetical protein ACFFUE_03480 [Bergeyella porcorum]
MKNEVNSNEMRSKKTSQSVYASVDEKIYLMKLAFTNASTEIILPKLEPIGYTKEKLDVYLQKVAELENLSQKQKKEYADKYAETERMNNRKMEINEIYMRHLALCRILFKGNTQVSKLLEFSGERKFAYGAWYQQVNNFYAQILSSDELKQKVASINIKEEDLQGQIDALEELSLLKKSQKIEMSEAQKATKNRDIALDEIYSNYLELIAYAKIIFQDSQDLEALGIVVKR